MGGEGSMMAANQSLKTNRNLLAKRKERKGLEGSYAGIEISEFPKMSEKDLKRFREELLKDRKITRMKQLFVLIFFLVLCASVLLFLFQ